MAHDSWTSIPWFNYTYTSEVDPNTGQVVYYATPTAHSPPSYYVDGWGTTSYYVDGWGTNRTVVVTNPCAELPLVVEETDDDEESEFTLSAGGSPDEKG